MQTEATSVAAGAFDDLPAGFRPITTKRYLYQAETCREKPLVGHLLNLVEMPPVQDRAWYAFIVQTTAPTLGAARDGKGVEEVPVGSEVLITATYELRERLARLALDPEHVCQVYIRPLRKDAIGGGHTIWSYRLAEGDKTPRATFGSAAMLAPTRTAPALPVGTDVAPSDDIPF